MKKTLILLSCILLTSAYASPPMPASCPDVMMIKAKGLSNNLAQDSNGNWYAGRNAEFYGTSQKWTFVIGNIFAKSKVEALAEAYEALQSIVYVSGPTKAPSEKWLCLYSNPEGFPTGAIYPPINNSFSASLEYLK